ncbi:MAG: hypothetical protein ACO3E1_03355 [Flavobacteriales bacterium]
MITVPSDGSYSILVEYSSKCSTCMPKANYGDASHEQWTNGTEQQFFTSTADDVNVNMYLASNTSAVPCGGWK